MSATVTATADKPVSVISALGSVMRDVQSVAKRDRNAAQGFSFRGIDAVVNAVGPALRANGVVVVPSVKQYDYASVEVGKNRTPMAQVRLTVAYTFYGPAGDFITAVSVGEAMDSGDKATAKAMSVAFRTALLQALCLPTDEPDPDHDVYERAPTGIPSETYEAIVAMMETLTTLDELNDIAASLTKLNLSDSQRKTLRDIYTQAKARVDAQESR